MKPRQQDHLCWFGLWSSVQVRNLFGKDTTSVLCHQQLAPLWTLWFALSLHLPRITFWKSGSRQRKQLSGWCQGVIWKVFSTFGNLHQPPHPTPQVNTPSCNCSFKNMLVRLLFRQVPWLPSLFPSLPPPPLPRPRTHTHTPDTGQVNLWATVSGAGC